MSGGKYALPYESTSVQLQKFLAAQTNALYHRTMEGEMITDVLIRDINHCAFIC